MLGPDHVLQLDLEERSGSVDSLMEGDRYDTVDDLGESVILVDVAQGSFQSLTIPTHF